METQIFTRQQLYDKVWSEPLTTISKHFDVSDAALRKICKDLHVPLPPNGHWQKIRFGKPIIQTPLPLDYQGSGEVTLTAKDQNTPKLSGRKAAAAALIQSGIRLPEKLTNPDPLVIAARKKLADQRADSFQYIGTKSCNWDYLDIRVAEESINRTLLLIDTFIKVLRARGNDLQVRNRSTYAVIDSQDFEIHFRERMKRAVVNDKSWTRNAYLPTGLLYIRIDGYYEKEWTDGKHKLEEQFGSIISYLKEKAKEKNERHTKWEKQRQEKELEQQRQQEFERRQEKELAAFKDILSGATRWHKAGNLRSYIAAIEENAKAKEPVSPELTHWLTWARKKADWYDPFTEEKDELLDDVDKETLTIKKRPTDYPGW
ncbi:hypothetical protein PV783_16920 [Chitinophaga sp. CC14]|uniref:hypothetical protein n=1 Tax=Chitinophaga sp. CC14 TaxID=3029199 RepID=UPI003B765D49